MLYTVKLDMFVKGLPASVTRHFPKHFSERFDCLFADSAVNCARGFSSSCVKMQVYADKLSSYVNYVVQYDHGITTGDVSLVRRYTVYNADGKRVLSAVYTDYFDFV